MSSNKCFILTWTENMKKAWQSLAFYMFSYLCQKKPSFEETNHVVPIYFLCCRALQTACICRVFPWSKNCGGTKCNRGYGDAGTNWAMFENTSSEDNIMGMIFLLLILYSPMYSMKFMMNTFIQNDIAVCVKIASTVL